jgi:predicted GNAT family acetyltransferase
LRHLYVDIPFRRQGIARRLLAQVSARALAVGAHHIWLETSSLNVPGAVAYGALGFQLTGLDLTLYDATPAAGETALFFSKQIGV